MTRFNSLEKARTRVSKATSPLLHSPKGMELILNKERMRCDRHGHFFALIVIQNEKSDSVSSKRQFRLLAKILHRRLRLTDEKGHLIKGGIGVLLPMTDLHGARVVLNSIRNIASRSELYFDAEIFTYSGREKSPHMHILQDSPSDSGVVIDLKLGSDETIVDSPKSCAKTNGVSTDSISLTTRVVRADDMSQNRRVSTGQLALTSSVPSTHICRGYPLWKRCMDICFALIGLIIATPFILIAAIAIKLTSKGPIFFRQMRTGQFGNAFPMYKLRTMVVDAEELKGKLQILNERDGPAFKIKNDPRVTKVGALLRKTGLDELPQLWNVLMGDMAIVGPRPLPCSEDALCEVWQRRRLDTKPGLTCVWQISKSRKISFADWMRMDLSYADKRTIGGDICLMFKTVMAVFLGRVGH